MAGTEIDHSARAHSSTVGGSSASRVLACPGSVALCRRYPSVESEFAAEGTALHEAIDFILSGETKKDRDVIGLTFNGYEITDDHYVEAIAPALEYFDQIDEELGPIDFLNEQRVEFEGIPGAFGTTDIIGTGRDRTVVLDWKFGRGVAVSAEENAQMQFYAYAAMHTKATAAFFAEDKPVELFVVQPRVMDGEPFTRWITSTKQLKVFANRLRKAVDIAGQKNAPMAMGPHCKFCNGKPGCDLFQGKIAEITEVDEAQLAQDLAKWLPLADLMTDWAKNVKNLAHSQLENGSSVPGYKLVAKRANRSWVDEAKALKLMANAGIPAANRYKKDILSVAAAETLLKEKGVVIPKELVEKISSGTTLATEDDKRPAVITGGEALKRLAVGLSGR